MRRTDPTDPQYVAYAAQTYPKRRSAREWAAMIIVGIVLAGIVLAVIGLVLRQANVLPVGIPLVGKDTGIAACESIAKSAATGSGQSSPAAVVSDGDRQKLRKVFSGSRYAEIRDPGVRFVDLVLQVDGMGPDAGLAALPLVGPLTESYAGLAGGCAEHGYTLPSLFGK